MNKFLRWMFRMRAPLLQWQSQDGRSRGGSMMTYAKSAVGTYEIYWSDDCSEFLLSFPMERPAELFKTLHVAIAAAQCCYNKDYFNTLHG